MFIRKTRSMPTADTALPGRDEEVSISGIHFVNDSDMKPPFPDGSEVLYVGMGCFWGAERIFWKLPGVITTAAGYQGGYTRNPSYEEVCTGGTGHTEAVMIVFDPERITVDALLKEFWEQHDPTTPNRQGNDVGTQYRSAVYWTTDGQRQAVLDSAASYQNDLTDAGFGSISTETRSADEAGPFYYAEEYHQQYLAKNPNGYCNHGFCQIAYRGPTAKEHA
jgi:peptide-methionine (S)-S-oxide reductase